MIRLDLHVHSRYSGDATGTLKAIAAQVTAAGLDGFALCDHNTAAGHKDLPDDLLAVPAVEVSSAAGHILAIGARQAPQRGKTVEETCDEIRDLGGIPVAAHPLRARIGIGTVNLAAVQLAESHNARDRTAIVERTAAICQQSGLATTGGSDAHHARHIGTCWTAFPADPATIDDVLDHLDRGRCHGEGSPLPRSTVWRHSASVPFRLLASRANK